MSTEKLGQYFVPVEDPRCSGKVEHGLIEMLVITVCAVIACAESCVTRQEPPSLTPIRAAAPSDMAWTGRR